MCIKRNLNDIYKYHAPSVSQIDVYTTIREQAKAYALLIGKLCPESRERTIALDRVEEAVMWANASVARNS